MTSAQTGTSEGREGTSAPISMVIRTAIRMPSRPPTPVSVMASIRNWPNDVAAARAEGLANADLARALGDADQHDVHHADAAHQQAEAGDGDGDQPDQAGDAVELLDDLVRRGEAEIVLRAGRNTADFPQDVLHLLEGLLALAGPGLGRPS